MALLSMWECCCDAPPRLGADIDICDEKDGIWYGGGGRLSDGDVLLRTIELSDGEKRPLPDPKVSEAVCCRPYGVPVDWGCHML